MNIRKENILLDKYFPFSISDVILPPGYDMDKTYHWHDCLEISYVKRGTGRYYIEGRKYEICPGDIIILNNIEPHYLEVDDIEMNQPVITFDPSFVWSNCSNSLDYEYLKPFFDRGTDFSNKLDPGNPLTFEVKTNLALLEQEYFEKPEGYHLMIKARLLMILTYLIRYFRDSDKMTSEDTGKRLHLMKIEKVLQHISENFTRDITLEEAASMIYVSPQYFSTFFKKVTGVAFVDYINNLRVNHAIKLLSETGNKITYIASECGFNNTAYFNRMFKKFTGKTPSDYRQLNTASSDKLFLPF